MTKIESYWGKIPGYAIDLLPWRGTATATHDGVELARSSRALIVRETDHVDRLYFPVDDVNFELLVATDHHTICPFKGEAGYWTIATPTEPIPNGVWAYPEPMDEVAGLAGHVCFYEEQVAVTLVDGWEGTEGDEHTTRFPVWGDAADLLRLIDVEPVGDGQFRAPRYHDVSRNVVEGGQMLAQAIVAAAKTEPTKRVVSASMLFPKAAAFDAPLELSVEAAHAGRQFSALDVRIAQRDRARSVGQILLDAGPSGDDPISGQATMPDVGGPLDAVKLDGWMTGREIRVVDAAYDPDPDRVGPPVIYAWCRFRDDPGASYLHTALMAQSTTHWTIAAAMRPHPGVGEAQAHETLATGIMGVTLSVHDDIDVTDWLLYANPAIYAGRGLAHSQCQIFTAAGRHVASYTVQAMVRSFDFDPTDRGLDSSTAM